MAALAAAALAVAVRGQSACVWTSNAVSCRPGYTAVPTAAQWGGHPVAEITGVLDLHGQGIATVLEAV